MSLIQQALKRKMDEQQAHPAPPPLTSSTGPGSPAPAANVQPVPAQPTRQKLSLAPPEELPPAPQAVPPPVARVPPEALKPPQPRSATDPEHDGGSSLTKIAIIFVLLLVVGVVAFWFVMQSRKQAGLTLFTGGSAASAGTSPSGENKSGRQGASGSAASAGVANQTKATPGSSLVPLPDVVAIHAKVEKMKDGVAEFRKANAEAEQGVVTPAPVQPAPVVSATLPVVQPSSVVATPSVPPAVATVVSPSVSASSTPWPSVRISGVMGHAGKGHQSAIINDSLINVGESLDGMTLTSVRENSVTMEYKGESREFSVGRRR